MEMLPPEIVLKILSYLDTAELSISRQVCRRWWSLSSKICNPLYLPLVVRKILQYVQCDRVQNMKNIRLSCKLWKDGLDKLTLSGQVVAMKGLTNSSSHDPLELPHRIWNPFPSRIVRMKLCYGHDNPEVSIESTENRKEKQFMEWFGEHVLYLQVSIQHSKCAEKHLTEILMHLKNLQGLIISESPSPYRFSKKLDEGDGASTPVQYDLSPLEKLKFLKLDDSDTTLIYSDLYKKIIESAPNLDHVELNGYHHLDIGIYALFSDRKSTPLHLTKLKMDAEDPHMLDVLKILNKADFPLIYFSLRINGFGDVDECLTTTNLLHNFLKKCGPTLERLELKLTWFERDEALKYPLLHTFPSSMYLVKLQRLKLVRFRGSLDFIKDLCAIESILIIDRPDETFFQDSSIKEFCPTIKEYHLIKKSREVTSPTMKQHLNEFMYKNDLTFIPKYCGLNQEGFP